MEGSKAAAPEGEAWAVNDFTHRYYVTIGYLEAPSNRGSSRDWRRREWSFITEEISEDDAIWTSLREFRREELRTWIGWPRDVLFVSVAQCKD